MESNKSKISFVLLPEGRTVSASQERTVLEACIEHEIAVNHSCGGMGICGTCRILVEGMSLLDQPRNEVESEISRDRGFLESERLACQIYPRAGLKIRVP